MYLYYAHPDDDLASRLLQEQRLTKGVPKRLLRDAAGRASRAALIFQQVNDEHRLGTRKYRAWVAVRSNSQSAGAVDNHLTFDPLRALSLRLPIEGSEGLLERLEAGSQELLSDLLARPGDVAVGTLATWKEFKSALTLLEPGLKTLLEWIDALAEPVRFDPATPADASWQEQADATLTALKIFGGRPGGTQAWQRPSDDAAPYLRGVIGDPTEVSHIEHDIRVAPFSRSGSRWFSRRRSRFDFDIHEFLDESGRHLEVVNVNASRPEHRTGTDVIYYHAPSESMTLVQYKRLNRERFVYADDRFLDQLRRLERATGRRASSSGARSWRLSPDSAFVKLAYWPEFTRPRQDRLTPGMYLPVSYVRLLLDDPATLGPQGGRRLGYDTIERHLTGDQFLNLVTHGFVGTERTTVEAVLRRASQAAEEGDAVILAIENSDEDDRQRQQRANNRKTPALKRLVRPGQGELFNL